MTLPTRIAQQVQSVVPGTEPFDPSAVMGDLHLPSELAGPIAEHLESLGFTIDEADCARDDFDFEPARRITLAQRNDERILFLHIDRRVLSTPSPDNIKEMHALFFLLPSGVPIRVLSPPLLEPHLSFLSLVNVVKSEQPAFDLEFISYGQFQQAIESDVASTLLVRQVLKLNLALSSAVAAPTPMPADGAPTQPRDTLFVSYSHKDGEEFLETINTFLEAMANVTDQHFEIWSDQKILAADDWKADIEKALARSRAALLLLSAGFFASEFIKSGELPQILEAAQKDGLLVFWVKVGPWELIPESIKRFQGPLGEQTVLQALSITQREEALARLTKEIDTALRAAE